MAVNGTGSVTNSLLSSTRMNVTGLASGMNTEEIIAGMTIGTTTKIQKIKQDQTLLNWKTDAFRNITDKLVSLSSKYTSYMSPNTNLLSTRLFAKTLVSAQGANAAKVSVSGAGHDNISIAGIKQMAANAAITTGATSSGKITTGEINLTDDIDVSKIEGGNLKIKYGGTELTLNLDSKKDYSSAEDIVASLNTILSETNLSAGTKLSEKIKFELDGAGDNGKIKLSFNGSSAGNSLEILGGSEEVLKGLGLEDSVNQIIGEGSSIEGTAITKADYIDPKKGSELLTGKTMTFMLDGTRKTIKLSENAADNDTIEKIQNQIQNQLNDQFGAGRITVGSSDGKLSFETVDKTSVLKLSEADKEITGSKGVFGNIAGSSNRINLDAKIGDAGFAGFDLSKLSVDADGNYKMNINGKNIEGITKDTTVREMMDLINQSDAGVKVSYMEMADRFNITSTVEGVAGDVQFEGEDNLATQLFNMNGSTKKAGQDSIIAIKYKDTDEVIEITRSSNVIDLEGMKVSLNGTFGYGADGNRIEGTEEIKFEAKVDDAKLIDAVKGFIKDYNEMLDAVNSQVSTKPTRNSKNQKSFQPLTDQQREHMSDKEIERWETEAKKGILFNDMDLKSMLNDFRFIFGSEGASIGIKVSSKYTDNGKLEFDEEAFKNALVSDPQKVQDFFAKPPSGTDRGGAMYKVKETLDKFARTEGSVKGILVAKAGHSSSPTSMLDNALLKQSILLDKNLTRLQATLKTQEDRYYRQFTNLETFIQKMNMQSGYLMQQSGLQ